MRKFTEADIGKRIIFRAPTRWDGFKKRERKINGIVYGNPTVRYGGYSDFQVRPDEVIEVIGEEA